MPKEPRSIQVLPRDAELDQKIDKITGRLRTSRSGLASLALEYVVEALESGRAVVTNGELHIIQAEQAA
jgi:predicted transcriptional regulator